MIASADLDAILIATPHYDHTTLGIKGLDAGLHACARGKTFSAQSRL